MSVTNNARGIAEGLAFRAPATAVRVRGLSDRAVAWLFILPTMLLLLAINIFPLIWAIRLSFTGLMANLPTPARFIRSSRHGLTVRPPQRCGAGISC